MWVNASIWVSRPLFLGPRISSTSSPLPMGFFFLLRIIHGPLVRHPWTRVIPALLFMGTMFVYIIHGSFALRHCSNPLATLFVRNHCSNPLATLFVGSFSLLGLHSVMYTWVGSKYTHPVFAPTAKGTMFPLSICERNFHNLATLPHTTIGSDTR